MKFSSNYFNPDKDKFAGFKDICSYGDLKMDVCVLIKILSTIEPKDFIP